MPRKARDVKASLTGKFGFSPAAVGRDKGHEWFLAKIARQLRVRRGYMDGMIDCANSSDAYRTKLRENPDGPLAGGNPRGL